MRHLSNRWLAHTLALLARPCAIAVLCVLALAGCASDTPVGGDRPTVTNAATAAPTAAVATATPASETSRSHPASKPQPAAAPQTATGSQLAQCDQNVSVRAATTTCGFAQNVFYSFFMDAVTFEPKNTIRAYSPASQQDYRLSCKTTDAERVKCVASDGGEVRFSLAALFAYDDDQAASYARTHDLGPNQGDDPSSSSDPADESGALPEGSGPSDPGYGDEIPNYDEGRGYRVQCADGMYSKSGGIQGACSGHGGLADGPTSSDSAPSYGGSRPSGSGTVHVDGYYRKDGTYVQPHTRRAPCSYC